MLELLLAPIQAVEALIGAGGQLVAWIFVAGVAMWMLIFERMWYFRFKLPKLTQESLAYWNARPEHKSWAAHQIRQALVARLNAQMSANLPMMKTLVPLCPLLGLVGTVSGMLEVFDSMAILGSADARTMAAGVSKAMNCTMTGLAVSVSGMYPLFHFQAAIRRETELLADHFQF
jgi:biopolymer transport protein ExbB